MSAWISRFLFPLTISWVEWTWVYPWLAWWFGPAAFGVGRPLAPATAWFALTVGTALAVFLRPELPTRLLQAGALLVGLGVAGLGVWRDHFAGSPGLSWVGLLGQALLNTFREPSAPAVGFWLGLGLYWRGLALGTTDADYDDLYREFTLGLGAQVVLFLVGRLRPDPHLAEAGLGYLTILSAVALVGLALARLVEILRRVRRTGAEGPGLAGPWLFALGVTVLGLLAGAMGAAFLLLQEPPMPVRSALGLLGEVLLTVLLILLLPLGLLAELLVVTLGPLIRRVWAQLQLPTLIQPGEQPGRAPETGVGFLPPDVIQGLQWLAVAAVLGLALALIVLAVTRARRHRVEADVEEMRESIWSWSGLAAGLKARLRSLADRLRRTGRQPVSGGPPLSPEALTVREIYRQFLGLMARRGLPRRADETPLEFLGRVRPDLEPLVPEAEELTRAYLRVRYGEQSLPQQAAGRIREGWVKIRRSLSRQP